MADELTEEHHGWMSSFFGVDTRGGVMGALSSAASAVASAASGAVAAVEDAAGSAVQAVGAAAGAAVGAVESLVQPTVQATASAAAAPPPTTPADPAHAELYRGDAADADSGTESDPHAKISENDINQGQVGDCFVLSSAGEIAKLRPDVIKSMIADNGDGTYTVTLHQKKSSIGNLWGLFDAGYEEVKVKVNADQPGASVNRKGTDAMDGDKKVEWPLILEKAYAQVNGGYGEIDKGGDPAKALGQLTGKDAETKSTSNVSLDDLKSAAAAGKPMTFNTPDDTDGILQTLHLAKSKKLPYGLHGGHAYMFEGLETGEDGKTYVRLKNPWGYGDPKLIPYDKLSTGVSSISTGEI